jgi:hypothetical protein
MVTMTAGGAGAKMLLAIAMFGAVAAACKGKERDAGETGAASAQRAAAPTPRAVADAAVGARAGDTPATGAGSAQGGDAPQTVDPASLAGARVIPRAAGGNIDGTAVGPSVDVWLLQRLTDQNGVAERGLDLLLVLGRESRLVVELGSFADADLPGPEQLAPGTLVRLAPLSPPRPWTPADTAADHPALPTKAPLQYLVALIGPSSHDELAIAVDGGALVVWHLETSEHSAHAPKWRLLATVALAERATIIPR